MDSERLNNSLQGLIENKYLLCPEVSGLITKLYKRMKKSQFKILDKESKFKPFHINIVLKTTGMLMSELESFSSANRCLRILKEKLTEQTGITSCVLEKPAFESFDRDYICLCIKEFLLDDQFENICSFESYYLIKKIYFLRRGKRRNPHNFTLVELKLVFLYFGLKFESRIEEKIGRKKVLFWLPDPEDAFFNMYNTRSV